MRGLVLQALEATSQPPGRSPVAVGRDEHQHHRGDHQPEPHPAPCDEDMATHFGRLADRTLPATRG